jgi:hypothetical protein
MLAEDIDTHQASHVYGIDSLVAIYLETWRHREP